MTAMWKQMKTLCSPVRIRRMGARAACVLSFLACAALPVHEAAAQQGSGARPKVIRDAEIENLLRDYTRPLLKVAGLAQQNVDVVLISDRAFNAFVADGKRIFINVGTLMDARTPNQVTGVLAHEIGHISSGHLVRMREQIAGAQTMAIVGMLLAGAGVAAGAAAGASGSTISGAAAGAMTAPQEMVRRSLLSYQRGQELEADRLAVRYLTETRQSAKGMIETFERFQSDQLFLNQRVDPYLLSHPMARERIAALEQLAKASPFYATKDPPELQARHDMMRAKLFGFMERPDGVARRYPLSDTSLPAQYARAISAYRYGNVNDAVAKIDALIARQPGNAYFLELKGQALLEAGRAGQAVPPLQQAVRLSNGNALIRAMLGQALVESGNPAYMDEAIRELSFATQRDPNSISGWRSLAVAYGRKGDLANADLASAQAYMASGEFRTGQELAARARQRFKPGTPGWLKADDILNFKPPAPAGQRS